MVTFIFRNVYSPHFQYAITSSDGIPRSLNADKQTDRQTNRKMVAEAAAATYPTNPFTTLELQNPSYYVPEEHKTS